MFYMTKEKAKAKLKELKELHSDITFGFIKRKDEVLLTVKSGSDVIFSEIIKQ